MITDQEIQKIFDWADKNDIQNRGTNEEVFGDKVLVWRKGIPRRKKNLLEVEYLELDSWKYEKLSYIPSELLKLPKLKGLFISSKQLNLVGKENLSKITFLKIDSSSLSQKKIIDFINILANLTHLKYLHILYGNLSKIPEVIFNFHNLKYLKLYNWDKIKELPSEIKNLNKLEVLSLEDCDLLTQIPIDIKELNNLKILSFRWSANINNIPKEIGNLTQLKELDLRWTNIKKLPDEMSNLINLEKLNGEAYIRIKNEEEENKSIDKSLLRQFKEASGLKRVEILRKIKISKESLTFKEKRTIQKEIKKLLFLLNPSKNNPFSIFSKKEFGNLTFKIKTLLLKGVPGTGKSRAIENIINNKLQLKDHKQNILRINIHSASSNADLMQGIGISSIDGKIEYKEKQGLILNFIEKATFNPNQPFVLVLEEIQENSLNELIGDLIYLIEDDKRAKGYEADDEAYGYQELVEKIIADNPETAYVEIPYLVNSSTEYRKMVMPDNLYIFCTSNYRDDKKVIEDNLLRRFEVLEIYPKYKKDIGENFKSQDVSDFLEALNAQILKVLEDEIHPDRFLIGHSNWLKVESEEEFYRAFLKVVVEFKDIKEVEFSDFKEIVKDLPIKGELNFSSYKSLIEDLQTKAGYDFLD